MYSVQILHFSCIQRMRERERGREREREREGGMEGGRERERERERETRSAVEFWRTLYTHLSFVMYVIHYTHVLNYSYDHIVHINRDMLYIIDMYYIIHMIILFI